MSMEQNNQFHHLPVLHREVVEHLTFDPNRRMRLIDGTIGGGGHSRLLLARYPKLELLGIDRDDLALAAAKQKLEFAGNRVTLVRGNYAELAAIATEHGWDDVDGILLDIGVSSPQSLVSHKRSKTRRERERVALRKNKRAATAPHKLEIACAVAYRLWYAHRHSLGYCKAGGLAPERAVQMRVKRRIDRACILYKAREDHMAFYAKLLRERRKLPSP